MTLPFYWKMTHVFIIGHIYISWVLYVCSCVLFPSGANVLLPPSAHDRQASSLGLLLLIIALQTLGVTVSATEHDLELVAHFFPRQNNKAIQNHLSSMAKSRLFLSKTSKFSMLIFNSCVKKIIETKMPQAASTCFFNAQVTSSDLDICSEAKLLDCSIPLGQFRSKLSARTTPVSRKVPEIPLENGGLTMNKWWIDHV